MLKNGADVGHSLTIVMMSKSQTEKDWIKVPTDDLNTMSEYNILYKKDEGNLYIRVDTKINDVKDRDKVANIFEHVFTNKEAHEQFYKMKLKDIIKYKNFDYLPKDTHIFHYLEDANSRYVAIGNKRTYDVPKSTLYLEDDETCKGRNGVVEATVLTMSSNQYLNAKALLNSDEEIKNSVIDTCLWGSTVWKEDDDDCVRVCTVCIAPLNWKTKTFGDFNDLIKEDHTLSNRLKFSLLMMDKVARMKAGVAF